MLLTKCVWQYHDKKSELDPAFDYFRFCANEGIRIGVEKHITSKLKLHYEVYFKLRSEFYSRYVYGALECAASKLKLYKKIIRKKPDAKTPYVWKNHLILDNQSYKLENDAIRIPIKPRKYVTIKLNHYVIEQIKSAKLGSITLTENKLVISYSKLVMGQNPAGFAGVDRNLNNATTCDTNGIVTVYDMSKITEIKQKYMQVKSNFKRNDVRIRKKVFQKYGIKQKHRVQDLLHKTSKKITSQNTGVVMEDIKGIRKLYRKGNGQGKKFRGKMNSWSFYELQRQIEYKARWLGLPVKYVRAAGTSSKCAMCGSKMVPEEHRTLFCPSCKKSVDRDVNAARNILAIGLAGGTKVVPDGAAGEAMVEEPSSGVILKVDAAQLACRLLNT